MSGHINWTIVLFVTIASLIGAVGALFLKKGSKDFNIRVRIRFISEVLHNKSLLGGILLYVLSTVFFMMALRLGELSVVYPLTSLTYIFTTLLSMYFLKEHVNWYKWLGIACIIAGVIMVKA